MGYIIFIYNIIHIYSSITSQTNYYILKIEIFEFNQVKKKKRRRKKKLGYKKIFHHFNFNKNNIFFVGKLC